MFTPAKRMNLSQNEQTALEALARAGTTTQRMARRCRVILLAAQGRPNREIARQVGVSRPTVLAVRAAYVRGGVGALERNNPRHCVVVPARARASNAVCSFWLRFIRFAGVNMSPV